MPNIASALKSEILRIARKEVRAEVLALRKSATSHRKEIAHLKQRAQSLEQMLRQLGRGRRRRGRRRPTRALAASTSAPRGSLRIESASDCRLPESGFCWALPANRSTTGNKAKPAQEPVTCLRSLPSGRWERKRQPLSSLRAPALPNRQPSRDRWYRGSRRRRRQREVFTRHDRNTHRVVERSTANGRFPESHELHSD